MIAEITVDGDTVLGFREGWTATINMSSVSTSLDPNDVFGYHHPSTGLV